VIYTFIGLDNETTGLCAAKDRGCCY